MISKNQWTWTSKRTGIRHIVRADTTAGATARAKVATPRRLYRMDDGYAYITTTMPSSGQCIDLMVHDFDRMARNSMRRHVNIVWRLLASLGVILLGVLPYGLVDLIATGYAASISASAGVEAVDLTTPRRSNQ